MGSMKKVVPIRIIEGINQCTGFQLAVEKDLCQVVKDSGSWYYIAFWFMSFYEKRKL